MLQVVVKKLVEGKKGSNRSQPRQHRIPLEDVKFISSEEEGGGLGTDPNVSVNEGGLGTELNMSVSEGGGLGTEPTVSVSEGGGLGSDPNMSGNVGEAGDGSGDLV